MMSGKNAFVQKILSSLELKEEHLRNELRIYEETLEEHKAVDSLMGKISAKERYMLDIEDLLPQSDREEVEKHITELKEKITIIEKLKPDG